MPCEKRERIERLDELHGFLHQSHISAKNLKRLESLCGHTDPEIAKLAELIQNAAQVFPGKRNRWLKLAQQRRKLFDRAVDVLGAEYFVDLLAGYGDFESPLWEFLESCRRNH